MLRPKVCAALSEFANSIPDYSPFSPLCPLCWVLGWQMTVVTTWRTSFAHAATGTQTLYPVARDRAPVSEDQNPPGANSSSTHSPRMPAS